MKRRRISIFAAAIMLWPLPSEAEPAVLASPTVLERMASQGQVTVCADPDNMPFSSSQSAARGFEIDLAQEVADKLGVKLNTLWFASNFGQRLFKQLAEGNCDFVLGLPAIESFTDSVPRLSLTKPYYSGGFGVIVRKDSTAQSLADVIGKPVGVEMATVPDVILAQEHVVRKLFKTPQQLFDAVVSGEVEAGVITAAAGGWMAKSRKDDAVKLLPQTRERFLFKIAMGVRKGDQLLKDAIDKIISDAEATGRLDKILGAYGIIQLVPETGAAGAPVGIPQKKAEAQEQQGMLILARSDESVVQMAAAGDTAADPKQIDSGRKLYKQACYKCHGEDGVSGGTVPDVRKFKDKGNDAEFLNLVRDGRAGTAMPPWKEILNDDEIKQIIAYVRSLPEN